MNSHRFSLTTTAVALLTASGVLSWWVVAPPARAAITWNAAEVFIGGTVTARPETADFVGRAGPPENVDFSGRARIRTRLAVDPDDSRRAKILLQIDLSGVTGVGATTAATYVIEASREAVHRVLVASDVIHVRFPFHPRSKRAIDSSRNGLATFALSFDTTTGAVTAAKASIGSSESLGENR